MSKDSIAVKHSKTPVIIDFKSALMQIYRDTGERMTLGAVSEETGVSRVTIRSWEDKAPEVVIAIYHFLKNHNMKFEDLVREVAEHKKAE